MTIVTLKPCPFCGGQAALDFEPESGGYFVYCLNELDSGMGFGDCPSAPITGPHAEIEDAVAGWNVRLDLGASTSFHVGTDGTVDKITPTPR